MSDVSLDITVIAAETVYFHFIYLPRPEQRELSSLQLQQKATRSQSESSHQASRPLHWVRTSPWRTSPTATTSVERNSKFK